MQILTNQVFYVSLMVTKMWQLDMDVLGIDDVFWWQYCMKKQCSWALIVAKNV